MGDKDEKREGKTSAELRIAQVQSKYGLCWRNSAIYTSGFPWTLVTKWKEFLANLIGSATAQPPEKAMLRFQLCGPKEAAGD